MRTQQELFTLILTVAKNDERIRAVLLCGSRADPNAPQDKYQDFDIVYYVYDVDPFYNNINWINEQFGPPAIMQLPELMQLLPSEADGNFTYLMLFADGNRIDLSIVALPYIDDREPAVALLDKDNILSGISAPTDFLWHIQPPTAKLYADCCNEFWWCLNNVAKGIARDELAYTMEMYNHYVRQMLHQMIDWYIGRQNDFAVSAGKMGRYYKKYLQPEMYALYAQTYSDSNYMHVWDAVFTCCDLFRILAQELASHCGFSYNHQEDVNMMQYLSSIKERAI